MKQYLLCCFAWVGLFFFHSQAGLAQNQEVAIREIRQKYSLLHQGLSLMDSVEGSLEGRSLEGGTIKGYYQKKELVVMKVVLYGEMYRQEQEYYLTNGYPFFILQILYRYNRPITYDKEAAKANSDTEFFDPKKFTVTEDRFYFTNQKLIRWLDESRRSVKSESYQSKAKELLEEAESLKKEFNEIVSLKK